MPRGYSGQVSEMSVGGVEGSGGSEETSEIGSGAALGRHGVIESCTHLVRSRDWFTRRGSI